MAGTVAIIGGGLAGIAAALFAAKNGARPVIVCKGGGSTSFSSGGLDLAVDAFPPPAQPDKVETRSRANLARHALHMPHHPYLKLVQRQEEEEAENILQMLRAGCEALFPSGAELELEGDIEFTCPLFTSLGTVKYTNLFPSRTAGPESPGIEKPLVAGVRGLIGFDPWSFCRIASDNAQRMGINMAPQTAMLEFGQVERQAPALAAAIDRQPESFLDAFSSLEATPAEAVVLPPVLPLSKRSQLIKELENRLSMPVYETLSMPPSVPGIRLSAYLETLARKNNIPLLPATVTGYKADGNRIGQLELELQKAAGDNAGEYIETVNGKTCLAADSFVLAAGKYIGGGLEKASSFREKIFDLPVAVNSEFCEEIFIEKVLGHSVTDPHLLFAAGVLVDRELRPLDREGAPAFENLYAAGAVLSGNDYMTQGTGAGAALASGLKAGENAAKSRG